MIYTEISSIGRYRGIGEYLDKAIDYLMTHALKDMEAGHYEIDKMVHLNVLEYETIAEEGAFF